MLRPIWNGSISFGLVNIPIKMYNAVKKKTLHFNQLRDTDGCRIRLKKICSVDGAEVKAESIVKGYEISPEHYVTITAEELASVMPKANHSIEIEDFVQIAAIDPIYFSQSYYLEPDKGSAKAYSLLYVAMEKAKKVAIARFVLRNKQYLATIRPVGKALTLSTMFFADEIVSQEQLEALPDTSVLPDNRQLAMADQLITSLSSEFTPAKYQDEYYQQVMELIENKAEGQQLVSQPVSDTGGKVVDLMAALEASVASIKKHSQTKERRKKASVR